MALSLAVGLGPSTGRLGVLTAWGLGAKCKSPNRPNLQDLFMAWPWKPCHLYHVCWSRLPPTNQSPGYRGGNVAPSTRWEGVRLCKRTTAKPHQRLSAATQRLAQSESGHTNPTPDSGNASPRLCRVPPGVRESSLIFCFRPRTHLTIFPFIP